MDYLLGIDAVHAVVGFGQAAIVAEAVFTAKAATGSADGPRQAVAARQPQPDRTGADGFGIVADHRQCGRADTSRHMQWPRIHAHDSARFPAGARQLNQVGAAAQIDQGAGVVVQ